jgi:ABC-type proline/glycine betaine transport system substrate-binding protein
MKTKAPPEVIEFLRHYSTTAAQNNDFLKYMNDHPDAPDLDITTYFLKKYESHWVKWVPSDVANKVKKALPK